MALYQSCEAFRRMYPSNGYKILETAQNDQPGRSTGVETIGDKIDSVNELGETPLFAAIRGGVVTDLEKILARNPDLDPHLLRPHPQSEQDGVAGHIILLSLQALIADHVMRGNYKIASQIVQIFRTRANQEDYAAVYGDKGDATPLFVPPKPQANAMIDEALRRACTRGIEPGRHTPAVLAM